MSLSQSYKYGAKLVKGYVLQYLVSSLAFVVFAFFTGQVGALLFFGAHLLVSLVAFVVTEWRDRWDYHSLRWGALAVLFLNLVLKLFISSEAMMMLVLVDVLLFEIIRNRVMTLTGISRVSTIVTIFWALALGVLYVDEVTNFVHPNLYNAGPSFDLLIFFFALIKMLYTSAMLYFEGRRSVGQRQKEEQFVDYSADFNNYFAHYINTPLTTAISNIEIVKYKLKRLAGDEVLEKVERNFDVVTDGLDNVSKTARELANIHYLRSEVLRNGVEAWNPEQSVHELVDEHKIDLEMIIDYWPLVYAPENMVLYTLTQTILNALKYGKDNRRVRLVVATEEGFLSLNVFNVGNIPDFNVDVLAPFQRGNNTEEGTGTGLGLSLAKDLVDDFGCEFNLSNVGTLTRAQLKLPLEGANLIKNLSSPAVTSGN